MKLSKTGKKQRKWKKSLSESILPLLFLIQDRNQALDLQFAKLFREAGTNVGSVRMPEFKKYLQQAIDEDGPGSNKGESGVEGISSGLPEWGVD